MSNDLVLSYGSTAAFVEEVTWATPVARTVNYDLRTLSPTLAQTREGSPNLYHGGNTAMVASRIIKTSRRDAGMSISLTALTTGFGLLLKAAMGSVATQADTPSPGRHTHTYAMAAPLPSLTGEFWLGTGRGTLSNVSSVMPGLKAASMVLTLASHQEMIAAFEFVGQDYADPGAAGTRPTTADPDNTVESTYGGDFDFNSASHPMTGATVNLNNTLERRDGYGTETTLQPYMIGARVPTITIEREYIDDTFKQAFDDKTSSNLELSHTDPGNNNTFDITLISAELVDWAGPQPSGFGRMTETLTFQGTGLTIQIVNSQASGVQA